MSLQDAALVSNEPRCCYIQTSTTYTPTSTTVHQLNSRAAAIAGGKGLTPLLAHYRPFWGRFLQ